MTGVTRSSCLSDNSNAVFVLSVDQFESPNAPTKSLNELWLRAVRIFLTSFC